MPKIRATGPSEGTSVGGIPPWGTAAQQDTPVSVRSRTAATGSSTVAMGTRKLEPAAARTSFGLYGSTPPTIKTPVAPKASADRTRVPALPGSPSSARTTSGPDVDARAAASTS